LDLNPRYVQARDWHAFFYLQLAVGRLEEGIIQAKLALEADPLSGYANAVVGICYFNAGMYAEAMEMLERALELDPDSFLAGYFRFCTLDITGRFEEAVARGQEVLMMSGRHAGVMAHLIATYSRWGRRSQAEALYAELDSRNEPSPRSGRQYKFATLSGTSRFQSIFRTVRACTKMHVAVNSFARLGFE